MSSQDEQAKVGLKDLVSKGKSTGQLQAMERQFFPRRYRMPSWTWPLAYMVLVIESHKMNLMESGTIHAARNSSAFYRASLELQKNGGQVYVVEPDCLEALKRTNAPDDLWINDLQWPFSGFLLAFPRGSVRMEPHGDLQHALVCRDEYDDGRFMIRVCTVMEDGTTYNFSEYEDTFNIGEVFNKSVIIDDFVSEESYTKGLEEVEKPDQDFFRLAVKLCMSCLMLMNSDPGEVFYEPDLTVTRKKKKKKDPRDWVNPRFLGKTFLNPRKVPTERSPRNPPDGSRHMGEHWKMGHWRNQPYGPRDNPKYKLNWIRPFFVPGS